MTSLSKPTSMARPKVSESLTCDVGPSFASSPLPKLRQFPRDPQRGETGGLSSRERGQGSRRLAAPRDLRALRMQSTSIGSRRFLLGFCGAPWTVASYMIAGRGTPDLAPARLFAYRHPSAFGELVDRLVDASIAFLSAQFAAGVEAVQKNVAPRHSRSGPNPSFHEQITQKSPAPFEGGASNLMRNGNVRSSVLFRQGNAKALPSKRPSGPAPLSDPLLLV